MKTKLMFREFLVSSSEQATSYTEYGEEKIFKNKESNFKLIHTDFYLIGRNRSG